MFNISVKFANNAVLKQSIIDPERIYTAIGGAAKFVCSSETQVQWYFDGGKIPVNSYTGNTASKLYWIIISNIRKDNAGIYSCYSELDDIIYKGNGVLVIGGKHFSYYMICIPLHCL